MENIDTLIEARWVIPVEPAGTVLHDHAVAVRDGLIVGITPTDAARAQFAPRETVQLPRHAVIPGLVNLHCHTPMTLLRGLADDVPLMPWLQEHIWPAETRHVGDEFVYDGSLLAAAELLRGGTTCVNDMYFFPEATARAALSAGLRASLGIITLEFPTPYAPDAATYLHKGLATRDAYRGEELLSFCLAPHAPYTVSDETFQRVAIIAEEIDAPIHIHVHETLEEIRESLEKHGARPLARLQRLGLVSPRLIGVHAVHLEAQEIDLLAREGAFIAHCPASNLKLASGLAPMAQCRASGVTVGIGTDGVASNNRLDMLAEMRLASLLAKGSSGDARAWSAHDTLRAATLDGARAIGLGDRIGSIKPGKAADLAAIDLDTIETQPCYDPVSHLVNAAGREHVTDVWVGGEQRLRNRALTSLDEAELRAKAHWWRERIRTSP